MTSDLCSKLSQHFELTNFAWFILKYWFFRSRRPKMTLFFQRTSDSDKRSTFFNSLTLHVVCWNIVLGPKGIQKHIILFFHLTSKLSLNNQRPLIRGQNFEFTIFAWYMLNFRFFGPRNPKIIRVGF